MKRFLLFAGDTYYPFGGAEDYRGSFDTLEEAQSAPTKWGWHHVAEITEDGLRIVSQLRSYEITPGQWVTSWKPFDWIPPDLDGA